MSDVVRGAKAVIVALASDEEEANNEEEANDEDRSESGEHEGKEKEVGDELVYRLLTSWAQSIWTFPELLISKGESLTWYLPLFKMAEGKGEGDKSEVKEADKGKEASKVYEPPESYACGTIAKNQFAARCLETDRDRYQVRRLIDHYLGSLKLSDLELTSVALECFSARQAG